MEVLAEEVGELKTTDTYRVARIRRSCLVGELVRGWVYTRTTVCFDKKHSEENTHALQDSFVNHQKSPWVQRKVRQGYAWKTLLCLVTAKVIRSETVNKARAGSGRALC